MLWRNKTVLPWESSACLEGSGEVAPLGPVMAGSGILHLDMAEVPANPWHICTTTNPVGMRGTTGLLILPHAS